MVIGIIKFSLYLDSNHSLKEKRKIVKSIISKINNKFKVSIAEVGSNDKWQMIELGVSTVGNSSRFVNSTLDNIISYMDSIYFGDILRSDIDIFNI